MKLLLFIHLFLELFFDFFSYLLSLLWFMIRLDMKSIEALEKVLEDDLPKVLLEFGNPFEKQS